jgi:oxygen-independent coproporphyrinogen III oxidase
MSTLYIHIPFCKKKCPYCDFFSITEHNEKTKDMYTKALLKEFKNNLKNIDGPIKTLYFGGGSPLLLGIKNLEKIIKVIRPFIKKDAEITIELNPEHIENNVAVMVDLKQLGFTRISIGVQTTNKGLLRLIERHYSKKELINNIKWFKSNKIDVSLDFMFALPKQKISDLKLDIAFIKATRPHHVSFYMFTPPSRYKHSDLCPNDEDVNKMFFVIHKELSHQGYSHYEVSNFCLKDKESKHNIAYWDYTPYIGLGAGAHSFIKRSKTRRWNLCDVRSYINAPSTSFDSEVLDKEKIKVEKIMLGLRLLNKGIRASMVRKEQLPILLKNKLVTKHKDHIRINIKSLPIMDEIIKSIIP